MLRCVVCLVLLCGVYGCGNDGVPSVESCEQTAQNASELVLNWIGDHQTCEVDSDCVVVQVNGDCFDVCTRAISASASADFSSVIQEANTQWCIQAEGCSYDVPPCVPPGNATCNQGVCVD